MLRASAAILLVSAVAAGCGGGDEDRDRRDPFDVVEQRERRADREARRRAAPRWEHVVTLRGDGDATRRVRIAGGAIQWHARWHCARGSFALSADGQRLGHERCPGAGDAEAVGRGSVRLDIAAEGRWRVAVEQQVTSALREPPLPAMSAPDARVVSRGRFHPIDRRGAGRVALYRLPDGRHALRLEGFSTVANTDLFVWLSEARAPRTTRAVLREPHTEIAPLSSTIGDQNYVLPRDVDVASARSVVIWCEPIRIAYTAAPLRR